MWKKWQVRIKKCFSQQDFSLPDDWLNLSSRGTTGVDTKVICSVSLWKYIYKLIFSGSKKNRPPPGSSLKHTYWLGDVRITTCIKRCCVGKMCMLGNVMARCTTVRSCYIEKIWLGMWHLEAVGQVKKHNSLHFHSSLIIHFNHCKVWLPKRTIRKTCEQTLYKKTWEKTILVKEQSGYSK